MGTSKEAQDRWWLTIGLAMLATGSLGAAVSFGMSNVGKCYGHRTMLIVGALAVVVQNGGLAALAWWAATPFQPGTQDESTRRRLFDRHLVLIGSLLYMTAIAAVVALSVALLQSSLILETFQSASTLQAVQMPHAQVGAIVAMSTAFALIGALFFIANRLTNIRDDEVIAEPFSLGQFWGGLFVRCAEAVLLIFSLFLIVLAVQPPKASTPSASPSFILSFLPAIGLLGGMLIKSFEQVVFGLADRLFKAAEVLLPPVAAPTPPCTHQVAATRRCHDQGGARPLAAVGFGNACEPQVHILDCGRPDACAGSTVLDRFRVASRAKAAKAQIDAAIHAKLPPTVPAQSVSVQDDGATSRAVVSTDSAAIHDLAAAARSAVSPWP